MSRLKTVGMTFLITLGVVWIPWVVWFGIDTYLLGHHDPKFGRDGGFMFGVYLRGATGLVSAAVAAGAHMIETTLPEALPWNARRPTVVLGAVILSGLSPIVPHLRIPGLEGVLELVLPWALVSLFCVTSFLAMAHGRKHDHPRAGRPTTG